nr:MAG TPA: hypothetical protein [Caudoviricetes sp.]
MSYHKRITCIIQLIRYQILAIPKCSILDKS